MMRSSGPPTISPDVLPEILREVRQSLVRGMPDHAQRFLRDIPQSAPASQETPNHDT